MADCLRSLAQSAGQTATPPGFVLPRQDGFGHRCIHSMPAPVGAQMAARASAARIASRTRASAASRGCPRRCCPQLMRRSRRRTTALQYRCRPPATRRMPVMLMPRARVRQALSSPRRPNGAQTGMWSASADRS
eukprot:929027-Prymnesium_polylepis.1